MTNSNKVFLEYIISNEKVVNYKVVYLIESIVLFWSFLHQRMFKKFESQYVTFTIWRPFVCSFRPSRAYKSRGRLDIVLLLQIELFLGAYENTRSICRAGSFLEPFVGPVLNLSRP